MNNISKKIYGVMLFLLVVVGAKSETVTFNIGFLKNRCVVGQPLEVIFTLKPNGAATTLSTNLAFTDSYLKFFIRHESESDFRLCGPRYGGPYYSKAEGTVPVLNLERSGVTYQALLACYGGPPNVGPNPWSHLFLPIEGKYFIRAKLLTSGGPTFETNEAVIDVVRPEGDEAKAFEIWNDLRCALIVQDMSMPMTFESPEFQAAFEKLRRITIEFPESSYGHYAKLRLAKDAGQPAKASQAGVVPSVKNINEK